MPQPVTVFLRQGLMLKAAIADCLKKTSPKRVHRLRSTTRRIEATLERGFLKVRVRIPYDHAALVDLFHRKGTIATERHTEKGTLITGSLPARFAAPFRPYAVR